MGNKNIYNLESIIDVCVDQFDINILYSLNNINNFTKIFNKI